MNSVKVYCHPEIKVVNLEEYPSGDENVFRHIVAHVIRAFPLLRTKRIYLQIQDKEGEKLTVKSNHDLVRLEDWLDEEKSLKIFVKIDEQRGRVYRGMLCHSCRKRVGAVWYKCPECIYDLCPKCQKTVKHTHEMSKVAKK